MAPKSAGIRVKEIPEEREPSAEEVLPALSSVAEPVTPPPEIDPDKRALLGEDNPVNGAVAIRVLEKLGFEVDTVTSGWEAVQIAGQNTYSVILLDCDSPAIGGYHTVMEIRDRENPKGIWTPILALTAYTMQWDRQQREAAGIDGYIAKPIQVDAMKAVLSRFAEDQSRPATMQLLALDRNMLTSLRKLTDGDGNQLEELVHLFIETSGRLLDQMETGLASGDLPSVAMAAHSMRGSSGQVGAKRMEEISSTIEALSRAGAGSGLGDWIQELRMAYDRVRQDLEMVDFAQLPPAEAAVPVRSAPIPRGNDSNAEILMAEDDPLIARFLGGSLTGAGFTVTHVGDGESALEALKQQSYGCVILDLNMPKLDGYGVVEAMRQQAKTQSTPVLILSLRSQENDIIRAFDLGADDYVSKPFSPLEVISRIRRLMVRANQLQSRG